MKKIVCVTIALAILTACKMESQYKDIAMRSVQEAIQDNGFSQFGTMFVIKEMSKDKQQLTSVCGYVKVNGSGDITRFMSLINESDNTELGEAFTTIEDIKDRRATVTSRGSAIQATLFDEIYWNKHCIDDKHKRQYTALY